MPRRQPTPYFAPFTDTTEMNTVVVSDLNTITASSLDTDSNIPQTVSNLNIISYHSSTDNTAYNVNSVWTPPASGHLVKFTINIAALMEMTAFTNNSSTFTGVNVTLTEVGTGKVIWKQNYLTGFAAVVEVADVEMFVAHETVANQSYEVSEGVAININVTTVFTQTDTNTITFGVVPFFPLTINTFSKFFTQSGVVFYIDRDRGQHGN